ncbi:App1 family protein [Actinomyces ruminicola]|uniref:Phosphatidate phosphatase APP1 n=1 Tax=Actinomyces ruminicola TaxID=332524 RepID=A0A1G9RYB0_9ACTO|nr:phosphatase domain-containing protein [Actinomyces ruminicola]SDM28206.1 Phosphatidate phosphatase APP1 [Actinomyces ruminicola]
MPFSDIVRAVEDQFHRDSIPVLRRRRWRPRVIPYAGYGSAAPAAASARPDSGVGTPSGHSADGAPRDMARVLARMVMRPPNAPSEGPLFQRLPEELPATPRDARRQAAESLLEAQRGWRMFIDVPVPHLPVTVRLGGMSVRTRADREGYVDVVLRGHGLPPGWHEATLEAAGAAAVTTRVLVVAPGPRLGIVCDIDDTVMVSHVPRMFVAAWNQLVKYTSSREPVPGMAQLLTRVQQEHPGAPVIYLSTGAWNVVPTYRSFFERNGFPEGPMLMTDWGPTNTGLFRSGIEHKRTGLRRLMIDLPEVKWLLVGDDGQHDPLIYGEAAREHSDRVAAVAIRRLTPTEQVLAGTQLTHPAGLAPEARALAESGVPVAVGADGFELARSLRPEVLAAQLQQ